MKKILLVLSLLSMVTIVSAQKIEYDKVNALNKRVMYTNWQKVNWNSDSHQLEISMLLEGTDMSLLLNWQCKEMVGSERNAEVLLFFGDGSKVVLNNKSFSVSGVGKVVSENVSSSTMGIQINAKGDFRVLTEKTLKHITVNTTSGLIDFPVTEEEALELAKMYDVFEKRFFKDK